MKRTVGAAMAATLLAPVAEAGGIERAGFASSILFEEGTYSEFSLGAVAPNASGIQASPLGPFGSVGASSGDVSPDFTLWSFGFKTDVTESLALALIVDQPIGADVDYADPAYAYGANGGSTAAIDAIGVTAVAKYALPNDISIYGGIRALQTRGDVALFNGYRMSTSTELDFGYLVGAAWERPEIAARVALTYLSSITHTFDAEEPADAGDGRFSTTVPQSILLEAQTGIAEDTLLFGSIKWRNWTAFDITPDFYTASVAPGGSLVSYDNDVYTYSLGVGRRFNETWSGALLTTYEPQSGGFTGNLGPTDGFFSLGVAATRSSGPWEVTAGLRHIWIGSARTQNPSAAGVTLGDFSGNTGLAGGLRIAYTY